MPLSHLLARFKKVLLALMSAQSVNALFRYGVLAGSEHRFVLSRALATVVDIGANRGQFALAVRRWAPKARVVSFEPLPGPVHVFRSVFLRDTFVVLHDAAIGPQSLRSSMHVSARDDSSSLLPISNLQSEIFPGTAEVSTVEVHVAPLDSFVSPEEIVGPALLKLDVQGFEYEALLGCESMLSCFDYVYCECSFVELYSGQKLAGEVIVWLSERGFQLKGIFNSAYDSLGQAVQADFFFHRG